MLDLSLSCSEFSVWAWPGRAWWWQARSRQWISGYWRPGNPYLAQASHSQLSAGSWLVVVSPLSSLNHGTVQILELRDRRHHRWVITYLTGSEGQWAKLVSNTINIKCNKYQIVPRQSFKLSVIQLSWSEPSQSSCQLKLFLHRPLLFLSFIY